MGKCSCSDGVSLQGVVDGRGTRNWGQGRRQAGTGTSSSLGGAPSSVLPMRMTMSVVRNRKSGWSAMS